MAASQKMVKLQREEECLPDRISELPECLLVQILSLLPTKYAVRTGILSKRWKSLWNHVDSLDFDSGNIDYDDGAHYHYNKTGFELLKKFVSFVDNTLMQCTCPKFKKFSLCMDGRCYDYKELIEKWLRYVVSKNVGFLKVDFMIVYAHCALEWFLFNPELFHLELVGCNLGLDFDVNGFKAVNLTALRVLSVELLFLGDECMEKLLSACPSLEILVLSGYNSINFLNCGSSNLKKLKLVDYAPGVRDGPGSDEVLEIGPDEVLEINAPRLKELEVSGVFSGTMLRLINVSSLITAKLTFSHFYMGSLEDIIDDILIDIAAKLLESVHHVDELILGPYFTQALSVLVLKGLSFPTFKCHHLTLESNALEMELLGIARLLETSPHLETFSLINMKGPIQCFFLSYFDELKQNKDKKVLSPPPGNFQHLKNVIFCHCRNFCFKEEPGRAYHNLFREFEIAEYICNNSPVLERLVISKPTNNCLKCSVICAAPHLLMLFPILSNICMGRDEGSKWECRSEESHYSAHFSCLRV